MDIPISPEPPRSLYIALSDQIEDGTVLRAACSGEEILRFTRDRGAITAAIQLRAADGSPLLYALYAPEAKGSLTLYRYAARIALYADDALADEEWPLADFPEGEWSLEYADGVPVALFSDADEPPFTEITLTRPMHLFSPEGHNAGLGDCMPYWDGERFHLFYLFDRRSHASKNGLGAHRWAHISTADMRSWTRHPVAIDIDEIWEGSICTGSLASWQGRLYAFYAVRMTDGSPARLTWAVSEDGVRFRKSGAYVTLNAPYDAVSARDPMVFQGPDGKWNMLVTTKLAGVYEGGCLAWLRGDDPTNWTQADKPFLVPGYAGEPECPDWFTQNDVYVLAFSNGGVARYRISDKPYGPWRAPADDLLASPGIRVPKTAMFGDRRVCVGFLAKGGYAGGAVFEELVQAQDGSFSTKPLEETLPGSRAFPCEKSLAATAPEGLGLVRVANIEGGFRLRGRLCASGRRAGISVAAPGALIPSVELRFVPSEGRAVLTAFDEKGKESHVCERFTPGVENGVNVDILLYEGAAHATVGGASLTVRTARTADAPCAISLFALWGEAKIDSLALSRFSQD